MLPVLALSTSGLFATNPIPANDRKDITKARAAVGKNGLLLKYFSKYVRNDYETCVVAIKNHPVAYTYAGDVVKNGQPNCNEPALTRVRSSLISLAALRNSDLGRG